MARVLHFPSNTGNHPASLAAAERELGHQSEVICIDASPFYGDAGVKVLGLGDLATMRRWVARLRFAADSVDRYDVFHFNKGETFLPGSLPFAVDLWWLKRKGKTVVVTFQGSDARPHIAGAPSTKHLPRRIVDAIRRLRVSQIIRWADRTWCLNPDLVAYVPGSDFLPYASVDIESLIPCYHQGSATTLRVAHAPSNRALKGTAAVEKAVQRASESIDITLDIIENEPHHEVLERIRQSDVVVDQLVLGWYGGFAVEAMALGKPTIARIDSRFRDENSPLIDADATSLADTLIALAGTDLEKLGREARSWVEQAHNQRSVAERVTSDYPPS